MRGRVPGDHAPKARVCTGMLTSIPAVVLNPQRRDGGCVPSKHMIFFSYPIMVYRGTMEVNVLFTYKIPDCANATCVASLSCSNNTPPNPCGPV